MGSLARLLIRASELVYAALMRLAYPGPFLATYGRDMREMFLDRCRNAVREDGLGGLLAVWGRTVGDVLRHGAAERAAQGASLLPRVTGFRGDLAFALRSLRKSPGFTLVAAATLALGIGANTAVFSVINRVLLSPLPYPEPDRLFMVWRYDTPDSKNASFSYPDIQDIAAEAETFSGLAPFSRETAIVADETFGRRVAAAAVTHAFFDVLRVSPLLGRAILSPDEDSGSEPVVVLGYQAWDRDFGRDPDIVGRVARVNSRAVTVIGVMPPEFSFPPGTQLWTALPPDDNRNGHWLNVVGRLAPEATAEQAQAEASGLIARLGREFPGRYTDNRAQLVGIREQYFGDSRPALMAVLLAVAAVLLIGCANLANLLLARAERRRSEVAVRFAVGAGRGRIFRQFLTESLVLASVGGVIGVGVAYGATGLLGSLVPDGAPTTPGVSLRLLAFSSVLVLATSIVFGVAPALRAARMNPIDALASEGRAGGRPPDAGRGLLVVSEVAIAVTLLISAGLMVRTMSELLAVDLGFDAADVWVAGVSMPITDATEDESTDARITAFFDELQRRTEALSGVDGAGQIGMLPFEGNFWFSRVMVEGQPVVPRPERYLASWNAATPGYFESMRIRLVRGRTFDQRDVAGNPSTAVISETLARVLWPEGDPIGARITNQGPGTDQWLTVVGIVEDVRNGSLVSDQPGQVYLAEAQVAWSEMSLVVRTRNPSGVAAALHTILKDLDPELTIGEIRPMESFVEFQRERTRFLMRLLTGFSVIAITLAAIGTYGIIVYEVSQRLHELGVRRALGAPGFEIVIVVMGRTLRLAVVGVALGLFAGWGSTRLFRSLLQGVSPTDPATFVTVAVLSLTVGGVACLVPALRASRIDPVEALRQS